jgi:hypothetical protein
LNSVPDYRITVEMSHLSEPVEDAMTSTSTIALAEFAAGVERLGLAPHDAADLVELRRTGDCAGVQRRMADLVDARLTQAQAQLASALAEQAAAGGLGGAAPTTPILQGIPLAQATGRLQAAAAILASESADGECHDDCACTRAAAVTGGAYIFPPQTGTAPAVTADGVPIVCTLDADGGDMASRVEQWHTILATATRREHTDDGVAVLFDHDIARTAELARLLAAEYSCCSFGSYHLTIDAHGVRMEIRTPPEGRDALTGMFGTGN